ncbi:hypothetical protein PCANC_10917 [Puccinia coronata f. sp. avenae]|uniref:Allergen n=1 Tax=Puccinia coronata f. sp. avenae TaxID=200324 RepID=A0A2N5SZT9_9BASI|nr:hypothetical protein PCANC_10917 [Puccinia coronata f. sp. avenae]PLW22247.1 hypothetical protein PCASD_14530 [Puccinia coronata f. sp. avenae]
MGKIKDVLNSISKDEKNIPRTGSKGTTDNNAPRRGSKASSKETVESVAAPVVATIDPVQENSRRLSIKTDAPILAVDRRSSTGEPLSGKVAADTESQKVAAPVTHNLIKHEEVEEITRTKEHERHFHHVQHHIQPVKDKEVLEEVHRTQVAPVTAVVENIEASAEDAAAYESLGSQFKDEVVHAPVEKKIIDHGEKVQVKEHHHLHHVVQPVIEKETHERHRIHTTIPIHHVTHEAPIIQQSINHEPLQMDEFLKRGGSLSSGLTHSEIGQTLLTERRASIVANVPIQSVAATSSTAELETDLSKKLNI